MSEIIGNTIIKLEVVDSTNNYAIKKLHEKELVDGSIVLANEQSAGRGQIQNSWESSPGKNLTFSLVLFPKSLPIQSQFLISKIAAISLFEILNRKVEGVQIKWPNDIYVNDQKIAGILIENAIMGSRLMYSVVGIGLNVNQKEFVSNAPNPVSLFQLTSVFCNVETILNEFNIAMNYWYGQLNKQKYREIDLAYEQRLYRLNILAKFSDREGQFIGEIKGVNAIGQLVIEKENGVVFTYHFKEVEFIL